PFGIELNSDLPAITQPVVIYGGASPMITLQPAPGVNIDDGLRITAGGSGVKGLAFVGFDVGLLLAGKGGNVVRACQFLGNSSIGIFISGSPNNVIGGRKKGTGNVISGNGNNSAGAAGLALVGIRAFGNRVQGNLIGTNATGDQANGNKGPGVHIIGEAHEIFIGGTEEGMENV